MASLEMTMFQQAHKARNWPMADVLTEIKQGMRKKPREKNSTEIDVPLSEVEILRIDIKIAKAGFLRLLF
jgi:hypothetical protein